MAKLKLRRIDCATGDAAEEIARLRDRLSPQGDIVSARGRELTEKVFGQALSPQRVVDRICTDVVRRGLPAVLHYTEQLDGARLTAQTIKASAAEIAEAHAGADPAFLETVRRVRQNILSFQLGLLHRDAVLSVAGSHELRLRYRPLRRVGICVPGGAAAYPSTLLMTVCPAQAAGVQELAIVMPPTPFGAYNRDMLATCHELGVTEVYRVGGAQAVAALAYGVEGIQAVDMIVGPGSLFVTLAKRQVYGKVAIDMLAGPTEVVVLADDSAPPAYVAADLISQAEHAPGASMLITWHGPLLDQVMTMLDRQLAHLPRGDLARESLENFGALVLARDCREAIACANQIAPEHLHLATRDPETILERIENAGAIFLGHYTPVALGDYVAGPSHVLPTGGTARWASGLSANDFLRRSSVIRFSKSGLEAMAADVRMLAHKEGLAGHAASVDIRLQDSEANPVSAPGKSRQSNPC
ncbi:MAG: histidinol dehydrogenase [Planctomycetota bacterium]|nr:MAG: histidinol dehydrogenase [Planctomycetota bacterium]